MPGSDALPDRDAGYAKPECGVKPPTAGPKWRDRKADQHPGGLGRPQVILSSFTLGRPRVQTRAQLVVGPTENRHQYQADCRQPDADHRRLGVVLVSEVADGFCGDV